jgi:hypothetical protein
MARKKVWCPECSGQGAIGHKAYNDPVQNALFGPARLTYRQCARCKGRGWIYKASYLEDRLWELFRWL